MPAGSVTDVRREANGDVTIVFQRPYAGPGGAGAPNRKDEELRLDATACRVLTAKLLRVLPSPPG